MHDRLIEALETADLAVASCAGVADVSDLEPVEEKVRLLRIRLAQPADILVVALAGGTGSGKSSLLNALTETELADVGGLRPTTATPLAAIPDTAGESLDGLLDSLGIEARRSHPVDGLCLVDLPDNDSVEVSHRHRVDTLLPFVDVVVWVTDPEKYRDARLHEGYLRRLTAYGPQFICVLNRSDTLEPEELAEVVADLRTALMEDGLPDVPVVALAASPLAGPPIGVEEVLRLLETKRSSPELLYGKLLTDLEESAHALAGLLGGPVDYDERAADVLEWATDALVGGDVAASVGELTGFLDTLAAEVGGRTADAIAFLAIGVPGHVARISAEIAPSSPSSRRWLRRTATPQPDRDDARARLGEAIIRPTRALLAKRALALAAVAELGVLLAGLRSGSSR